MNDFFKTIFGIQDIDDDFVHSDVQNELIRAAESTMTLAKEISVALKNDINDTDKKLTTVCNLLQDQLLIVDLAGTVQFVNDRAKLYFTKESIINKHLFEVMSINFDNMEDLYKSTKTKNKIHYYDVEIDSIKYKMDISMSYIEFEDKKNVYVLLIDNITERIDYEQELIESNEKFKIFSELTNDAMAIIQDDKIVARNSRFGILTEYAESTQIKSFRNLFSMIPQIGRLFRHETIIKTKNGKRLNVSVNRENIIWNDVNSQIYVIRDISQFKQIEKNLELRAERFSDLLNNSYISLCCFDSMFNITYANEIFLKDFKLDENTVLSKSILDFVPIDDRQSFMEDIMNLTPYKTANRSLHICNEKYKDWIVFGKYGLNGVLEEFQCSIRDITNYYK